MSEFVASILSFQIIDVDNKASVELCFLKKIKNKNTI